MYKHILIPVDGSDTALKAVESAAQMARVFQARATVVYVIDPYPFGGLGSDLAYGQVEYLSAAKAEAQAASEAARGVLAAAGINAEAWTVESHTIWRGILETAQETGADLIVMGSHGRRGLEKMVLGSTAQRVLSHAMLPVLIVRG